MDWQLTCRVCLETRKMVSLFDWDENNEQLCDKYTYCCGMEVPKNDSLPTLICLTCVNWLASAYQFKQQCLTSNDTLKECLEEFMKSTVAVPGSSSKNASESGRTTIMQENGFLLQNDLPVEHDVRIHWTRPITKNEDSRVTKAPGPHKRGRPRKKPDEQGHISEEDGDDPDFEIPVEEPETDSEKLETDTPKKRVREKREKSQLINEDGEDVLLKETIMAFSEPIPDHLLNPKKKKADKPKKKYTREKVHTCETCGASFSSNPSLQAHIRRHLGIKPFVCSVCEFSCVLREGLRRHMRKHTGTKSYKCRICEKNFADYGTRQRHERLHMGVRPYQCTLCGKAFTYSYGLSNHMLIHTGEKKFSCDPCNKKFTRAHHLKYHNKMHHKELYLQQQLELEAKKMREQVNLSGLSGVISGQIVAGTLKLTQASAEDHEVQLHVVKEEEDIDDKETVNAVAGMQVILDTEYCIDEEVNS